MSFNENSSKLDVKSVKFLISCLKRLKCMSSTHGPRSFSVPTGFIQTTPCCEQEGLAFPKM